MPKFSTESKWLTHKDFEEGRDHLMTITGVKHENLAMPGQDEKLRWVLYFQETDKGLGLNKTNGTMLCRLFGTEEMNDWIGRQCYLYVKDDVEFQGEIVSAIRIRNKMIPGIQKQKSDVVQRTQVLQDGDFVTRIDLSESKAELVGIQREIALVEPMSDEDREALIELVNLKMQEIKKALKK